MDSFTFTFGYLLGKTEENKNSQSVQPFLDADLDLRLHECEAEVLTAQL
jgi:hypothetical protein